jgi:hypothetical protein
MKIYIDHYFPVKWISCIGPQYLATWFFTLSQVLDLCGAHEKCSVPTKSENARSVTLDVATYVTDSPNDMMYATHLIHREVRYK